MATVSTKCNGTYGSHYTLYLDYTLNYQSIEDNYSNVTVSMYARADSTSYKAYNGNATNPVRIDVDGPTRVSKNISMDFRNRKTVDMGSWTGNIYHNSVGKLTAHLYGNFSINGVSSLSGGEIHYYWDLPDIPRKSIVTCTDANIGSAATININRAVSSFTHKLTYEFGSLSGTIEERTSETSIGWQIPTSFYSVIPNDPKRKCKNNLRNI